MNRRHFTGLAAMAGITAMATHPSTSTPDGIDDADLVTGTGVDGLPVRRPARIGEAHLSTCVIRLDGDPADPHGWARRHDNGAHISLNVAGPPVPTSVHMIRDGHTVGGVLRVPFVESRAVAWTFAGADEALPALGLDVGVSGGVGHANLVFWHRAQRRYLDVTRAADRALATTGSLNIWFAAISVGRRRN